MATENMMIFLELKKNRLGALSQALIHLLILQKSQSVTLLRRSDSSTCLTILLKKRQKTTKQAEIKDFLKVKFQGHRKVIVYLDFSYTN